MHFLFSKLHNLSCAVHSIFYMNQGFSFFLFYFPKEFIVLILLSEDSSSCLYVFSSSNIMCESYWKSIRKNKSDNFIYFKQYPSKRWEIITHHYKIEEIVSKRRVFNTLSQLHSLGVITLQFNLNSLLG